MNQKYNSALGAFEILSNVPGPFNIGIGTGSTTDFFTKEFLPNIKNSLTDIYSSSIRTTNLLNELGVNLQNASPTKRVSSFSFLQIAIILACS